MKVSVLGSGSRGNATLVVAGDTKVLVDAGFSGRDLARRLDLLEVDPREIDGIVITHDHGDHTRGMGIFARRFDTPVYVTDATRRACRAHFKGTEVTIAYRAGHPFTLGALRIEPFLTVHDAVDPVGITLIEQSTGTRLGVATDLGRPTAQVRHAMGQCDFIVLEANHDETMLQNGPYPWSVKSRIASSHGHLSNQAAARFAAEIFHPRLAGVLLAHLSCECNAPDLARRVVGKALKQRGYRGYLEVASQDHPTSLLDIETLRQDTGPIQLSLL